jgi:hypothetical protein
MLLRIGIRVAGQVVQLELLAVNSQPIFKIGGPLKDVVVAQLMGHARLDTTRAYSRPGQADLESAVMTMVTD